MNVEVKFALYAEYVMKYAVCDILLDEGSHTTQVLPKIVIFGARVQIMGEFHSPSNQWSIAVGLTQ